MDLSASKVRSIAEVGVADNIEICEAGKSKRLAQASTASTLGIDDEIRVVAQIPMRLKGRIEGTQERNFGLNGGQKTVRADVWRMKGGIHLADAVGLSAQVVAGVVGMGEDSYGF